MIRKMNHSMKSPVPFFASVFRAILSNLPIEETQSIHTLGQVF